MLPSNHDVGEAGHHFQPVDDTRLRRWRARFGANWWVEDMAGWRLIGLDALILGSGGADEARKLAWLDETMRGVDGRRIAYKPLFLDNPGEGDTGYWSIKPQSRARLLASLERARRQRHLHKARDFRRTATRSLWASASSFLAGGVQPPMPGE